MRSLNAIFAVFATLALLLSAPVAAAALATVEAVQAPAWRDRGGIAAPLAAGMELQSGDVLRTGSGSRAYLLLAEGSRVKLGEAARFSLHSRSLRPEKSFRGALDIAAGAFRFTASKLKKPLPRELTVRVGTAIVGIHGADVWGKTGPDGDLVALLAGRAEISRAGEITEMTQPMTCFDAPSGRAAVVKTLDLEAFVKLARQTEILAGEGAARAKGKWRVLAAVAENEADALERYDQVREAGFAAHVRPRGVEGGTWRYEILLAGFPGAEEAALAAARLQQATGLKSSAVR